MNNQNIKEFQGSGPPEICWNSGNNTSNQKLPVDFPEDRGHNISTGKNEMDPKQRGAMKCDAVDVDNAHLHTKQEQVNQLIRRANDQNKMVNRLYDLAERLAVTLHNQ